MRNINTAIYLMTFECRRKHIAMNYLTPSNYFSPKDIIRWKDKPYIYPLNLATETCNGLMIEILNTHIHFWVHIPGN